MVYSIDIALKRPTKPEMVSSIMEDLDPLYTASSPGILTIEWYKGDNRKYDEVITELGKIGKIISSENSQF